MANATHHADMLWMAKGGGGEFPGVVTKIMAQAFDAVQDVHAVSCHWDTAVLRDVIRAWAKRVDLYAEADRSMLAYPRTG